MLVSITVSCSDSGTIGTTEKAGDNIACDPVDRTGCEPEKKCALRWDEEESELLSGCYTNGTQELLDPCVLPRDSATGVSDCVSGTFCNGVVCRKMCSNTDTCSNQETCVPFVVTFSDMEETGLCHPECNPLSRQDECETGEGCYVDLNSGIGTCTPELSEGDGLLQGEDCMFLNGCAIGYSCSLNNAPKEPTGLECAFYCDPNQLDGGLTCDEGPGSQFTCVSILDFYSDQDVTVNAPSDLGFCIDCNTWEGTASDCK